MYDNTNSGAIFKNEKKAENHPDYRGKINVDGTDKDIALWLKTSKDGKTKFFSVKITEPYVKANIALPTETKVEKEVTGFTESSDMELPF